MDLFIGEDEGRIFFPGESPKFEGSEAVLDRTIF